MRSSTLSLDQYKDKTIAVVYGGVSSEREVSIRSGQNVSKALRKMGLNIIELDPANPSFFDASYDILFNCLHGKWGEDGGLQGYCELRRIPYTGPGIGANSMGLNKVIFKSLMVQLNIPVPKQLNEPTVFPCISKPVSEGSSIGVKIIKSKQHWDEEVQKNPAISGNQFFIEEYINGRELTSGVIEANNNIIVFPILEIETLHEFYDYDVKYTPGKTTYTVPANIDQQTAERIERISRKIYRYFNCKGCIRIDFMLDGNEPKVLEMNTNPGITECSNIPAQAQAMGIDFETLLIYYLNSAK